MMPLRAISQDVRVRPHCSNSLFNIKKHTKCKIMLKHVFQFKHYYLNLFECFWICLCFLTVVSLHMMPLRAIPQAVRVQPHCSNNFYLTWKSTEQMKMVYFLCFLNVVSLHMMPLRALSQDVRFQPHLNSNNLFNIKKNRTNENAC